MTKKWVKEELKKNPLEIIIITTVNYFRENKNNIFVGIVAVIVVGLFAAMVIRNKVKETKEASKLFAFAQNDFDRFNYKEAIKKYSRIEKSFRNISILPQVLYFKGLSYYRQYKLELAEKELKKCIAQSGKNKIVSEARMALAAVYEDMEKFDEAINQYSMIKDSDYLKPEAFMGIARIYELMRKDEEAVEIYTKIQSHYINTYWGNFAEDRLIAFGVKSKEKDEFTPELSLE